MQSRNNQFLNVINLADAPIDFNDTSQLQQFINVDLDQINRERDLFVRKSFNQTLKQRRQEVAQCQETHHKQQGKVNHQQTVVNSLSDKL